MWSSFEMKIISTDENYFLCHPHRIELPVTFDCLETDLDLFFETAKFN